MADQAPNPETTDKPAKAQKPKAQEPEPNVGTKTPAEKTKRELQDEIASADPAGGVDNPKPGERPSLRAINKRAEDARKRRAEKETQLIRDNPEMAETLANMRHQAALPAAMRRNQEMAERAAARIRSQ